MGITASKVAKYIVIEFQEAETYITNMKLQKLLYYVQGWHLGIHNTSAFIGEFEAWVHGPVEYTVYQEYQDYKGGSIDRYIEKPSLNEEMVKHIDQVLECYGSENAFGLEKLTHKEWPWIEAREDFHPHERSRNRISEETMREYFSEKAQENEKTGNYIPNAETIKAFEESKRGVGIKTVNSWKEMFDEIYDELQEEGFEIPNYDRA